MNNKKAFFIIIILILAIIGASWLSLKQNGNNQSISTKVTNPCAGAPTTKLMMLGSSAQGSYLTDSKCMTLYINTGGIALSDDALCNDEGRCTWRPFYYRDDRSIDYLDKSSSDIYQRISTLKRNDNTYQYSYDEAPLYYYVGDKAPGDMNADGLDTQWSAVYVK